MTVFVLCERFRFPEGCTPEFAQWQPVHGVAVSDRRADLDSFERSAEGEQVSERRVFAAEVIFEEKTTG
jgi:hypothetical protein